MTKALVPTPNWLDDTLEIPRFEIDWTITIGEKVYTKRLATWQTRTKRVYTKRWGNSKTRKESLLIEHPGFSNLKDIKEDLGVAGNVTLKSLLACIKGLACLNLRRISIWNDLRFLLSEDKGFKPIERFLRKETHEIRFTGGKIEYPAYIIRKPAMTFMLRKKTVVQYQGCTRCGKTLSLKQLRDAVEVRKIIHGIQNVTLRRIFLYTTHSTRLREIMRGGKKGVSYYYLNLGRAKTALSTLKLWAREGIISIGEGKDKHQPYETAVRMIYTKDNPFDTLFQKYILDKACVHNPLVKALDSVYVARLMEEEFQHLGGDIKVGYEEYINSQAERLMVDSSIPKNEDSPMWKRAVEEYGL